MLAHHLPYRLARFATLFASVAATPLLARTAADAPRQNEPTVSLEVAASGSNYVIRKAAPTSPTPDRPATIALGSHIRIEAALLDRAAPAEGDRHDAR